MQRTFNQHNLNMKYLRIKNNGELDVRILSLMGGTTKRDNDNLIGNFGTGLKYSLAYLLRNNVDVRIFVGKREVQLTTKTENISNTDFNILYVNGERTSITDSMGVDWQPWMIVRELYSNALDEGGAEYSSVLEADVKGVEDSTSIFIELTPAFLEVYNNWSNYFIVGQEPFYEDDKVKIFPQSGNLKIYKQGILIHTLEKQSIFNYDFKQAKLNELREYKGYLEHDVYKAITQLNDKKSIQYFIENLSEEDYESTVDYNYSWSDDFNSVWEETIGGSKIIHQKAVTNLKAKGIEVDEASHIVVPEQLYKGLSKKFPSVGALRTSKDINDFYEIYNDRLHDKVKKAQRLLEDTGYYIEPELKFIYGIFGDKTVLAKIDISEKTIYISEKHLDTDMFSIMTMLVEENEHYKTGFSDHTRAFQQHFIDLYVNMLVEKEKVDLI